MHLTTIINEGKISLKEKKFEDALKKIEESINIKPTESATYLLKGDAYTKLEKFIEAIASYDKSIELDSNNSKAYSSKGKCYFKLYYFFLRLFFNKFHLKV
jgi:tetratricopeptide (TPR) repeat protein